MKGFMKTKSTKKLHQNQIEIKQFPAQKLIQHLLYTVELRWLELQGTVKCIRLIGSSSHQSSERERKNNLLRSGTISLHCDKLIHSTVNPGHFAQITCSPRVDSPRKVSRFAPLNHYYTIIDEVFFDNFLVIIYLLVCKKKKKFIHFGLL